MNPLNHLVLLLIKFYRKLISPIFGPKCRFYPSCSQYGLEAFQRFSFIKALWYSSLRILKCNPLHSGGYDPLPKTIHINEE
ncbi:MAG: membrane protein insertion efficiency factor YidD [Bacteriovoracaceae bacterium]